MVNTVDQSIFATEPTSLYETIRTEIDGETGRQINLTES